jgi:AcrR family transcriptional regulator
MTAMGTKMATIREMDVPTAPGSATGLSPGSVQGSVQAMRSERTRLALLAAAEKVFARDGFEASRIEDIAAEAGRSRGAFYANFENKTEVFLALRTIAVERRAHEVRARLEQIEGEDARHDAAVGYILEQICDTDSLLLEIEFKLFALRHPEMLEELSEKHIEAATTVNEREFSDLFVERKKSLEEMRWMTLGIEAVLEGFALNALFARTVMTESLLKDVVPRLLDDMLRRR